MREKLAAIQWDAENDVYHIKVAADDGTNVQFVAGTQLLEDLASELKRMIDEMSA